MKHLIDILSSAVALSAIIALGVVCIGIFILVFNKKKIKTFVRITLISIIIIVASAWVYLRSENNFGLAQNISDLEVIGNKICFTDYDIRKNKYGTSYNYRLFVVDEKNGELLDRVYIGKDVKIIDYQNNIIILQEYKTIYTYNLNTLEIEKKIDDKYLTEKFNELSIGIEKIDYLNSCLNIVAKNGKSYTYSIFDDQLVDENFTYDLKLNEVFSFSEKYITRTFENIPKDLYTFKGEKNGDLLEFVVATDKDLKSNCSFINGNFIDFDKEKGIILVRSFETTDNKKYILTALNTELTAIWTISYDELKPFDNFTKDKYLINNVTHYDNYFILASGGFLFKIDARKGLIIWKKRF